MKLKWSWQGRSILEEKGWSFGGGVRTIVDGYYISEDGTPGKPVWPEEDE